MDEYFATENAYFRGGGGGGDVKIGPKFDNLDRNVRGWKNAGSGSPATIMRPEEGLIRNYIREE
jgi:hypothetical protein